MQNTLFYVVLMLVAGLGIPTMAALNASLGNKIQSPIVAVVILLAVALATATLIMLLTEGLPQKFGAPNTPWYLYLGGCLFVLYIFSVTWVIPKFGVANAIGLVLFGQLIAMTLIDHFGLFGLARYEIDIKRLCGLGFMALGIFLVISKQID
jgi:transporter family-2 protein